MFSTKYNDIIKYHYILLIYLVLTCNQNQSSPKSITSPNKSTS